jgi:cytochrome b6-f complex iron-sulfur subunit
MSDPAQVNRRDFLATVAVATAAVVSLPVLEAQAARKPPKLPDKPIDVGPLTAFAKDGVTDTWAKDDSFFVVRRGGKLFAVSNICTHRFCPVQVQPDQFYCKCHKSSFTLDGEVTDGPAETSLPHYGISTDAKGHVMVDTSKEFAEAKWEDPASFIKV